jgi:hypothetical protein
LNSAYHPTGRQERLCWRQKRLAVISTRQNPLSGESVPRNGRIESGWRLRHRRALLAAVRGPVHVSPSPNAPVPAHRLTEGTNHSQHDALLKNGIGPLSALDTIGHKTPETLRTPFLESGGRELPAFQRAAAQYHE